MTLDDLDAILKRLRGAADAIGTNLAELEVDPHRRLLEEASLTGTSREQWSSARDALATLWDSYTRFTGVLDQAEAQRGRRARLSPDEERQLGTLLTGPSVELPARELRLGEGGLLGGRTLTSQCTPDELLASMADLFDQVVAVIRGAEVAWTQGVERVHEARAQLATAEQLSRDTGMDADGVEELDARVDAAAEQLLSDPLGVTPEVLDALTDHIGMLSSELESADETRQALELQLQEARRRLAELEVAEAAAASSRASVTAKISDRIIEVAPPSAPALAKRLDEIVVLAHAQRWRETDQGFRSWSANVDVALDRGRQTRASWKPQSKLATSCGGASMPTGPWRRGTASSRIRR